MGSAVDAGRVEGDDEEEVEMALESNGEARLPTPSTSSKQVSNGAIESESGAVSAELVEREVNPEVMCWGIVDDPDTVSGSDPFIFSNASSKSASTRA